MFRRLKPSRLTLAVLLLSAASLDCQPDVSEPQAPAAAPSLADIVEKSGVTVIPLGLRWDVDHDVVGTPARQDLSWERYLSVQPDVSFPEPTEARITLVQDKAFESINYASLAALKIDQMKIPRKDLQPGAVIALRSSEGALAKLRVGRYYAGRDFSFRGADNILPTRKECTLRDSANDEFFNIELEWTLYRQAGKENAGLQEALMEQLKNAVMRCKPEVMRELLGAHPELANARDEFGNPPLHHAADWGNAETLKVLIAAGADVNAREEPSMFTALEKAAGTGVVAKAEVLIASGADVNASDRDGVTPLMAAIGSGNPSMVEFLLKSGARLTGNEMEGLQDAMYSDLMVHKIGSDESPPRQGGNLDTIRRTSSKPKDFEEIARLLLAQGADVSKAGREGATQLHEAAKSGQAGVARQLLAAGLNVNAKDPRGRTPLHEAVGANQLEIVELLLSQGADVNAQDNAGQTPLHETAHCQYEELFKTVRGNPRIAELLLGKGADIGRVDIQGWTPLHHARYYGNAEVADLLAAKGANAEAATTDGFTCETIRLVREFFLAVVKGDKAKTAELIEANPALLNARCVAGGMSLRDVAFAEAHCKSETGGIMLGTWRKDPFRGAGWTALHEAVLDGSEEEVKLLLGKGADVNATTSEEGWTPLHVACWTESESMARLLLDAGADGNKTDSSGSSLLHEAVTCSQTPLVKLLLEHGANPNARNSGGLTPLNLEQKKQDELRPYKAQMMKETLSQISEEQLSQLPEDMRADVRAVIEASKAGQPLQLSPHVSETEEILRKHGAK